MNKNNHYLTLSCLQKSIRQGNVDLSHAYVENILKNSEKKYLFHLKYRLAIISVEDIGVGSIEAIRPYLNTRIAKKPLEEAGGDQFIFDTVKHLCEADKDRTACDLGSLAKGKNLPDNVDISNKKELQNIFLNKDNSIEQKSTALWLLGGSNRLSHPVYGKSKHKIEDFIETCSLYGIDKEQIDLMCQCQPYFSEPMWLYLGLCKKELKDYLNKNKMEKPNVVNKKNTSFLIDNYFLSSGFDKHTIEGKKAISQFLNDNEQLQAIVKKYSKNHSEQVNLIGQALFRIEGQYVDKRIYYPFAVDIYKKAAHNNIIKRECISYLKKNWNNWENTLNNLYGFKKDKNFSIF